MTAVRFLRWRHTLGGLVWLWGAALAASTSAQDYGGYPDPVTNPLSGLMLDLPGSGTNPTAINFSSLPKLLGTHNVVSQGDAAWQFRLHNYLAYYDNKYWLMWSHGPSIEDKATQHVRYVTSTDGLNWSSDSLVVGPSSQSNFRYIARGFWERDGELYALASHDEAGGYFGANLELRGYHWNSSASQWDYAGVLADDTINNFAPKQLSNGQWLMSRRGNQYATNPADRSWLVGGVTSIGDWQNVEIPVPATGARLEEPDFYELSDGKVVGLFRDNSGSKRIYRSFSTDYGLSWSQPVATNFPDATAKFFAMETSRGYHVLISNANPSSRNPLTVSVSLDGLVYTRMAALQIPGSGSFQYPHAIEQDGDLLIAFSRNKTSIETFRLSLDEIDSLLASNPTYPSLVNGNFENTSSPFPQGWTIVGGSPSRHAGLGGSANAAFLHRMSQGGDRIRQDVTAPGPTWEMEFLFATADPGDDTARGLNVILTNSANGGTLNLRVNGDGSVQTVEANPTTWFTIPGLANAVQFSVDANGDGDFSDPGDVLNMHRLLLRGDFTSTNPTYTVELSLANSNDLVKIGEANHWFGSSPTAGSSFNSISFSAQNSAGSFLIDEVVLRSLAMQPGDFDWDGDVDGADFVIWQTHFPTASGASRTSGDADGDGDVDGADFVIWQTNFPFNPSVQAVPEPSGWTVAWIGAIFAIAVGTVAKRRSQSVPIMANIIA